MKSERLAKYAYNEEREEWLGIVFRVDDDESVTLLTAGCEDSEDLILQWCEQTLRMMNALDSDEIEAPDKYERAKPH